MKPNPVLVIGGSGTLGVHLIPLLLQHPKVSRVRVMSRGEHRQSQAAEIIQRAQTHNRVDWFLGDVRDLHRVEEAMEGCETVLNFAAVKSVDRAEYDVEEAVKTIVDGARNTVRACKRHGVKRAVLTSTDKAVSPFNAYGAAKMAAEKIWISEGNKGASDTKFSCMRYGNVLSSQGSVIAVWKEASVPKITDPDHTRFFITPQKAAQFVFESWKRMEGGEIFIPKMKSTTIVELWAAFATFMADEGHDVPEPSFVGARPGEKKHEALISSTEAEFVSDCGGYFIRWPENPMFPVWQHGKFGVKGYTSETADRFTQKELIEMIREVI